MGCADEAARLARAATQAALSTRGRVQIIKRIAEATNAAKQAPTMRAKAIKALSGVVRADTSLLALPEIQHSVNGALKVSLPGTYVNLCSGLAWLLHEVCHQCPEICMCYGTLRSHQPACFLPTRSLY